MESIFAFCSPIGLAEHPRRHPRTLLTPSNHRSSKLITHVSRPRRVFTPPSLSTNITCQQTTQSSSSSQPTTSPAAAKPEPKISERLEQFLKRADEGDPLTSLRRAEAAFDKLKARSSSSVENNKPRQIVTRSPNPVLPSDGEAQFDVVIAGGTLGILYATALQARGWRVAVIERGKIRGRVQEWNISRDELSSLVANDVVDMQQLEECIVTECLGGGRIGFVGQEQNVRALSVANVLNVGVAPDILIAHALANFISRGGVVYERHSLENVVVAPDAVKLNLRDDTATEMRVAGALGAGGTGIVMPTSSDDGATQEQQRQQQVNVTARLLIDAMGSFSPIAEQSRDGRAPDGVCITVGACMTAETWASPPLEVPDILVSRTPINSSRSTQYFWEAFPVGRDPMARTAYMFSYGPCEEGRQTLTSALEDFVDSIEDYQGTSVENTTSVKRVLFGFFPSFYRTSTPVAVAHDRVLPVGDAGGLQSPISFGGFGCCVRHLPRICTAVSDALHDPSDSLLMRKHIGLVQWYMPSLAVTGLFHTAMSVTPGQTTAGPLLDEFGINDVLWTNMMALQKAGPDTQRAFLRDVVTAPGLTKTLVVMATSNLALAVRLTAFVGLGELFEWMGHYFALVGYASARPAVQATRDWAIDNMKLSEEQRFWLNRLVDAMTYGSGYDAMTHE